MMRLTTPAKHPVRLAVRLDRWKTLIAGIVGGGVAAVLAPRFFTVASANGWSSGELYSIVVTVFSIITGVLFTFYGIVVSSENEYMQCLRIGRARAYSIFRQELKAAICLGAVIILCSVPFVVVKPTPTVLLSFAGLALVIWFGLVTAGAHLFWRVASIFFIMADDVPSRPPLAG